MLQLSYPRNAGPWERWFRALLGEAERSFSKQDYGDLQRFCAARGGGNGIALEDLAQELVTLLMERIDRGVITAGTLEKGEAYLVTILKRALSDARMRLRSRREQEFVNDANAIKKELSRLAHQRRAMVVRGRGLRRVWRACDADGSAEIARQDEIAFVVRKSGSSRKPTLAEATRVTLGAVGAPVFEEEFVLAILKERDAVAEVPLDEGLSVSGGHGADWKLLSCEAVKELLERVTEKERRYIEAVAQTGGATGKEIAEKLGMSAASVSRLRRSIMEPLLKVS